MNNSTQPTPNLNQLRTEMKTAAKLYNQQPTKENEDIFDDVVERFIKELYSIKHF